MMTHLPFHLPFLVAEKPIICVRSSEPGCDEAKRTAASSSPGVLATCVNSACVAWVEVQELSMHRISLIHILHVSPL